MKLKYIKALLFVLFLSTILFSSCKKDWLAAKSNKSLVIPSTLKDMDALLKNESILNEASLNFCELGTDDFYMTYPNWQVLISVPKQYNGYIWAKDLYEGRPVTDWGQAYRRIFYANIVLEGLQSEKLINTNLKLFKALKSKALYIRASTFYQLAQVFAPPYNEMDLDNMLGIPLRLNSDLNIPSVRASLGDTYSRIEEDLIESLRNAPYESIYKTDVSKSVVFAMLARFYLSMGKYSDALNAADSSFRLNPILLDYNTLNAGLVNPIPALNAEIIYQDRFQTSGTFSTSFSYVDSNLYDSYDTSDLRKSLYFNYNKVGSFATYRGSYDGSVNYFSGITTSEVLLIRAECNARLNKLDESLMDLNKLLKNRWKPSYFQAVTATSRDEVLQKVLNERRKELIYRGLRWTDLRRLNQEDANKKTLTRLLNGVTYSLIPGDARYTFPIPDEVIAITNMPQNPR